MSEVVVSKPPRGETTESSRRSETAQWSGTERARAGRSGYLTGRIRHWKLFESHRTGNTLSHEACSLFGACWGLEGTSGRSFCDGDTSDISIIVAWYKAYNNSM